MTIDRTLKLFEFEIPRDKFLQAPLQERVFFLQSLRIANEISSLEKAILASVSPQNLLNSSSPETSGQVIQTAFYIRLLAGILRESYRWIEVMFEGKPPAQRSYHFKLFNWNLNIWKDGAKKIASLNPVNLRPSVIPLLSKEAVDSLGAICQYFSRENQINKIRNKFGFHYDPDITIQSESLIAAIADPHIYLEEAVGNSLYTFAGQLTVLQMIKTLGGNPYEEISVKKIWEKMLDDVQVYARHMQRFYVGYALVFTNKHLNLNINDSKHHILQNVKFSGEVVLPFFTKNEVT